MNPTTAVNHRNKQSWSDYFLDPKNEADLDLSDIATKYTDDSTKLLNAVEAFQESAALLVPGAHKSVRFMHHCFNDLTRNWVIGVCGLKRFAPLQGTQRRRPHPSVPPTVSPGQPQGPGHRRLFQGDNCRGVLGTHGDQRHQSLSTPRKVWVPMDPPFTPGPLLLKGVKGSRHSVTTHLEGPGGRQRRRRRRYPYGVDHRPTNFPVVHRKGVCIHRHPQGPTGK
jgi:hypothetical protein